MSKHDERNAPSLYRDHNFLGTTESLCPQCLGRVGAKIISRGKRVYFRKYCPQHGVREDFVCSDVDAFDRTEFSLPGKRPARYATESRRGCPYDCGVCPEHEQHTCIGLLEITSHCNLKCPICFASSGPGGAALTLEQCRAAIDALVAAERHPEVLQISGGEPTTHPDFETILRYACDRPIDIVMVNTNGIRIARDPEFVAMLASLHGRCEVYLQFDSFEDSQVQQLRGQPLVETKLRAIEILGQHGIRTTLVCTLQAGVNGDQIGPIAEFAAARPWITGINYQPTTYSGRHFLPSDLEGRITFPDVIRGLAEQTGGRWQPDDFCPLPCAHPNAHTVGYAFRQPATDSNDHANAPLLPLARFIDVTRHLELLTGRFTYDRDRVRNLVENVLKSLGCGGLFGAAASCGPVDSNFWQRSGSEGDRTVTNGAGASDLLGGLSALTNAGVDASMMKEFLSRAMGKTLVQEDMLRITTTTFMDAYNFDIRQLMRSCVHHVLPSGHLIPFSAYNVLYREGHIPLPPLAKQECVPLTSSRA